jgi:hypothetical protein
MSAMGGKQTLLRTPQSARQRGTMQSSFVTAAGLILIAGCGERPGSNNHLESEAIYARSCGVAPPGWMRPGDNPGNYPLWHLLMINRVRIEADNSLRWNGDPVTRSALRGYFAVIPDLVPPMAVVLRVDGGADCKIVRTIRQDMEELLRCRSSGLCGEGDGEWD